jgi:hypothetical protein
MVMMYWSSFSGDPCASVTPGSSGGRSGPAGTCASHSVGFAHLIACPGSGSASYWVEAKHGGKAAADAVVITTHIKLRDRTNNFDDLVGTGTVAHDVSEIPQNVVLARCIEHGVEGL